MDIAVLSVCVSQGITSPSGDFPGGAESHGCSRRCGRQTPTFALWVGCWRCWIDGLARCVGPLIPCPGGKEVGGAACKLTSPRMPKRVSSGRCTLETEALVGDGEDGSAVPSRRARGLDVILGSVRLRTVTAVTSRPEMSSCLGGQASRSLAYLDSQQAGPHANRAPCHRHTHSTVCSSKTDAEDPTTTLL